MKVTLGGERLGTGKKMQVEMHSFPRSTHNLNYAWRSTIAPGTVVPFLTEIIQTGDTFEINLDAMMYTLPTNGPVYGSFNLEMHLFACPQRLYCGLLHSNTLGIGRNMKAVIYPKLAFTHVKGQDSDNPLNKTNPTSLYNYLGLTALGQLNTKEDSTTSGKGWQKFAIPTLAYWDIVKNYIVNKQEDFAYFINAKQIWQDVDSVYLGNVAFNDAEEPTNKYITEKVYPATQQAGVQQVGDTADGLEITKDQYIKILYQGEEINNFDKVSVVLKSYTDNTTTNMFYLKDIVVKPENPERIVVSSKTIPSTLGNPIGGGLRDKATATITRGQRTSETPNEITENYDTETISQYVVSIPLELPEKFTDGNGRMKLAGIYLKPSTTKAQLVEEVDSFPVKNLEEIRRAILKKCEENDIVLFSEFNDNTYTGIKPISSTLTFYNASKKGAWEAPMNGLALKTYKSDINNNWLSKEFIDGTNGVNEIAAVSTAGGSFTIDTLNLATKVYNMLNRIAASDGTYTGWQRAVYGQKGITLYESPVYLGGKSTEVVFEEVVANSASETRQSGTMPLGSLAGRGTLQGSKGGYIRYRANEDCILIGIVMLTPRIDYSQRNKWIYHGGLETYDDMHKPSLDKIGYQDLLAESMVGGSNVYDKNGNEILIPAVGKTIAWINYMTNVNETHGDFADENKAMYMTLNRNYKMGALQSDNEKGYYRTIEDATTYIDPKKYNYIFADASLTAQNFQLQIGVRMKARRVMAAKQIPNL